jgi:hypothetical protein
MKAYPDVDHVAVPFPGLSEAEKGDLEGLIRQLHSGGKGPEELVHRLAVLEEDVGRLARLVLRLDQEIDVLSHLLQLSEARQRCCEKLVAGTATRPSGDHGRHQP